MKILISLIIILLTVPAAFGQRAVVMTNADIQVRFPTADDPTWRAPDAVVSISYSFAPMGVHVDVMKLGDATWESEMWGSTPEAFMKAVIVISVNSIPSPKDRRMEVRVRNRYENTTESGPWSEPGWVDVIGKPKPPKHTG